MWREFFSKALEVLAPFLAPWQIDTSTTIVKVKSFDHQHVQVPKMEVLNLIRLFWGWVFPYISRIHTACIGEYLHFRYLKCLVIWCKNRQKFLPGKKHVFWVHSLHSRIAPENKPSPKIVIFQPSYVKLRGCIFWMVLDVLVRVYFINNSRELLFSWSAWLAGKVSLDLSCFNKTNPKCLATSTHTHLGSIGLVTRICSWLVNLPAPNVPRPEIRPY